jgi:hypothetical protein
MTKVKPKTERLPVHPVALCWSAFSPEDAHALSEGIKTRGVLEPVRTWTNSQGQTMLVDGRTRQEVWFNLVKSGLLDEDKSPLETVDIGALTESEMLDHVADLNGTRRHADIGQRAIAAVETYRLRQLALTEDEKAREEEQRLADDKTLNEYLALKAMTSDTTIAIARRVLDAAPKLAQDVKAGKILLRDAYQQIPKGRAGRPKGAKNKPKGSGAGTGVGASQHEGNGAAASASAGNGEQAQGEPRAAPVKPTLPMDQVGQPLKNKGQREIFQALSRFRQARTQVENTQKMVKELLDGGRKGDVMDALGEALASMEQVKRVTDLAGGSELCKDLKHLHGSLETIIISLVRNAFLDTAISKGAVTAAFEQILNSLHQKQPWALASGETGEKKFAGSKGWLTLGQYHDWKGLRCPTPDDVPLLAMPEA